MNKESFKLLMGAYGKFIANHPFIILAIALVITVVAAQLQATLEILPRDNEDFLPEDQPVIKALNKIGDEFGGLNTITIAIEVQPTVAGSNEIRDSFDPRMIAYAWRLHNKIEAMNEIVSVTSAASLLRQGNANTLPKSTKRVRELEESNPSLTQYLSDDHTLLLIKAEVLPDLDRDEVYNQLDTILSYTPPPPGVHPFMIGEIPQDVELDRLIGPDMQRVMGYSFMGIVVVVLLLTGSLSYGILPVFTIVFGTVWSMGMWAGLGNNLTANTSGVSSMIMGIGIDFGIQTINRFRQENKKFKDVSKALSETLANVVLPMSTTTLAALIGFRAMSMGELTALADMASIMSLGVLGCYLAALTVVPSLLIIYERYIKPIKLNEVLKK